MNPTDQDELIHIEKQRFDLYKRALKRCMKKAAAARRGPGGGPYRLHLEDRMRPARFDPVFLSPAEVPKGLKVLIVLPHPQEAAKLGGLVRILLAPDADGRPSNQVHAVVVMPGHRGVTVTADHRRREDLIDAVIKEGLDWAYVIGLNLGLPPYDLAYPLKKPNADLPNAFDYERRRVGDQFAYGPDGAYRFFNAWRTYDSGEKDSNDQRVDPRDQEAFASLVAEEDPDLVLLPDHLDPHPSQRTTREMALEGLRRLLASRHARGEPASVTLLEYASFQLFTPPRYNLWVIAPKDMVRAKTFANTVFKTKQYHNFKVDTMMAEGASSMAASDEFHFAKLHRGRSLFENREAANHPALLPTNITAENFTVSRLAVELDGRLPVVRETHLNAVREHFAAMTPSRPPVG